MTLEGLAACPAKVTRERENLGGWPFLPHNTLTHEPNASHRAKLKAAETKRAGVKILCL